MRFERLKVTFVGFLNLACMMILGCVLRDGHSALEIQ